MSSPENFVHLPKVLPNRTHFKFKPYCNTSLNVGELVPLYKPIEVIPGDTFKVKSGSYLQMTTMTNPVFDTLFFDIFWFYCPFRLLWNDFIYFFGENKQDPYDSINVYSMPQVKIPEGGYNVGTIANYFGIRPGVGSSADRDVKINAFPFRAYSLIVNEYFIADFLDSKADVNYDISSDVTGSNGGNYVTDLVLGGKPFIANKLHDRFTSALPKPQASESVPLPLGDNAFVYTGDEIPFDDYKKYANGNSLNRVKYAGIGIENDEYIRKAGPLGISSSNHEMYSNSSSTFAGGDSVVPTNFYADLSSATSTTINDLREAIIIQHMLESESRHGNRYFEQLVGDYGVVNDDLRLFRPEYLGGCRFSINVDSVPQTSATVSGSTPQGNLSAYSVTMFSHTDFTKSFKEPGLLICLGVARYPHSYPQGLDKFWTKKDKYDLYNHHFEGMGEQPVYTRELYFQGTSDDDSVFGYMPYGTEYRSFENIATGEMSPDYTTSLKSFHYGDDYDSQPYLSSEWLKEDVNNVDRTLEYPSTTVANFRCKFRFDIDAYRPLSMYGVPGLNRL